MSDVATHCPYCALQCGMTVGPAGAISPRHFPTNRGGLCRNGWTAGELLGHSERLTTLLPAAGDGARAPAAPAATTGPPPAAGPARTPSRGSARG